MPDLTLNEIFGSSSYYDGSDSVPGGVYIDVSDFRNAEDSGDILNGLGINNLSTITPSTIDLKAVAIFYALLVLIRQNQANGKNDDPEQKIYVAESGVSVVSSNARKGQLERRFTVSFFSDETFDNSADIDSI